MNDEVDFNSIQLYRVDDDDLVKDHQNYGRCVSYIVYDQRQT